MVWSWQRWLSPRPQHRTVITSKASFLTSGNAALYEPLVKPDGLWSLKETHYIEHPLVKAGLSGPPLHIHLRQDEYFQVQQGTLGIIRNGMEYVLTKDDDVFFIPACTRHRFWSHKSATESLIFTAWADPCVGQDHILDMNFLRNCVGYLLDCDKAGLKPSPFQLVLFFDNVSSLLCPPFLNWMPVWLLTLVHHGIAWIAESLLGYKKAYPEYTKDP